MNRSFPTKFFALMAVLGGIVVVHAADWPMRGRDRSRNEDFAWEWDLSIGIRDQTHPAAACLS